MENNVSLNGASFVRKEIGAILTPISQGRSVKPPVYVITTTYEEYRALTVKYKDLEMPLLYVYNPKALLTVDPVPVDVINMFDLAKVALPEERLWTDGTNTYVNASRLISDVLEELVSRYQTMIHTSMDAFISHLNEVYDSFGLTEQGNPS